VGKSVSAQDSYWVFFTDKKDVQFDPYKYFDAKAIARRIKNNVPINDPTDWPLNETYVKTVSNMVDSVSGHTRWFNALAVVANPEQIKEVQKLSFVKEVEIMNFYAIPASKLGCDKSRKYHNMRNKQLDIMGRKDFKQGGFNGKGIRIAIFDGGFPGVDTSPTFERIRNENRLIDTWDFTKGQEFVFYSIAHGTEVMSNIGGQIIESDDTAQYGLATEAEFLLAKTEIIREPFSEEKNWLMAVEWADKKGADIINSSLGYTKDRYFRADMNGKQSLVTRAGNMAARKGILVVNAIGNDGDNNWHIMGAPADADSVLAVGGIDPLDDYHISFSSFGPTADGRMKPNVCAFGDVVVCNPEGLEINVQGTSFASPLVAGFAACALQANPNMKTMDLFRLIEKSGHLYPYFDYAHGYGVPQAKYIISKQRDKVQKTFEAKLTSSTHIQIVILSSQHKRIGESQLMYFSMQKTDGTLYHYQVIRVSQKKFILEDSTLERAEYENIEKITIYYQGYIQEIQL
jgi:hypothetical protein